MKFPVVRADWLAPLAVAAVSAGMIFTQVGCGGGGGGGVSNTPPLTLAQYKAQMISIPAGTFQMGDDAGFGDETPVRSVTLSTFKMGRTEVTVGMWKEFCTATNRDMPFEPAFNEGWTKLDHPIVNISWEDAKAYADWAGLALPTEAQWEYAASSGEERKYPWGPAWDPTKCVYATEAGVGEETAVVGSKPAGNTKQGLTDMAGNVMEWCADWYEGYPETAETNPTGPATGDTKVYRGGAFANFWKSQFSDMFRTTSRGNLEPLSSFEDFGVRLVTRLAQ